MFEAILQFLGWSEEKKEDPYHIPWTPTVRYKRRAQIMKPEDYVPLGESVFGMPKPYTKSRVKFIYVPSKRI